MTEARDVFEDLARLAPRGPALLAGGRGGAPRWTAMDVAAAMSGRHAGDVVWLRGATTATWLALAKYAFDPRAVYCLERAWWYEVVGLAVDGGWQTELGRDGRPRARLLADATLTEYLCGSLCGTCSGAGRAHNQAECPACDGRGVEERSTWWWARELKCRHATAVEWAPRIRACFIRLQELEADARAALESGRREGEICLLTLGTDLG